MALAFPDIDPVALQLGPLAIRWYALAYVAGLIGGWRYAISLAGKSPQYFDKQKADDFLLWATLGVVLGGRLGYVLFYQPAYYLAHPDKILFVWQGGMSFHGGLLGVILAMILFCRRHKLKFWTFSDIMATVTPIGLFFGRIANFINGELFGRPTDVPWAMIFPHGGEIPRHPSQLYEALLEGALLFAIQLWLVYGVGARRFPGMLSGTFLIGYAAARNIAELFREPDIQIGFLWGGTTMGQLLSLPMMVFGLYLIWKSRQQES